jgi:hypothetical protein
VRDLEHAIIGRPRASDPDLRALVSNFDHSPATLEVQREYWQRLFGTSYKPILPSRLGGSSAFRTNVIIREGFPSLVALQARARSDEVTLTSVLVACWARVQADWTQSQDVAFGMMVARRGDEFPGPDGTMHHTDQLSVPTINVLPHRVPDAHAGVEDIARVWMRQLAERPDAVETSRMADICAWTGHAGRPICNVYLNIVKARAGRDVEGSARLLQSMKLQYSSTFTPDDAGLLPEPWQGPLIYPEIAVRMLVVH